MPPIVTERLTLRIPTKADFAPMSDLLMSERARYMGGPFDALGAWRELCCDVAGWALHGHGGLSITRTDSGALLGWVGLQTRPDFPESEMGWMLLDSAEGHGYAYEAAAALRSYAFETLGFETLVSYIAPGNARSIALAERLGAIRDTDAPAPELCDLVYRHPAPSVRRIV